MDVPNATVMLIEGADRFGLAQLHQLRGRVGRGSAQSYCLLIPSSEDTAENERLQAMVESNDGFFLAERDLQQRGPGEFLGTRQSGYASGLRMASLTDLPLIEKARTQAQKLFETDPELAQPRGCPPGRIAGPLLGQDLSATFPEARAAAPVGAANWSRHGQSDVSRHLRPDPLRPHRYCRARRAPLRRGDHGRLRPPAQDPDVRPRRAHGAGHAGLQGQPRGSRSWATAA